MYGNGASVYPATYPSSCWLHAMNQEHSHGSMPPSALDIMHTLHMNMSILTLASPHAAAVRRIVNSCIPMTSPSLQFMPASGNVDGSFIRHLASAPLRMGISAYRSICQSACSAEMHGHCLVAENAEKCVRHGRRISHAMQ